MKWNSLALGVALLGLSAHSVADVVGLTAGVTTWNPGFSGDVSSGGGNVDIDRDLNLDREWSLSGYVAVEHPVPVLPNVKLQFTELSQDANGSVNVTFDDQVFTGAVQTDLDLSHTDLILYYEVLDNVVSIDVGLNAKIFDGELVITDANDPTNRSSNDLSEVLPLLYVAPSVDLPFTGLSVGAELAGIAYSGNRLLDATARVRYEIGVAGVEAGYRQLSLKLDDIDDLDADIRIGGPYVGFVVDF